jgi:hypothetical protein
MDDNTQKNPMDTGTAMGGVTGGTTTDQPMADQGGVSTGTPLSTPATTDQPATTPTETPVDQPEQVNPEQSTPVGGAPAAPATGEDTSGGVPPVQGA